MKHRHLTGAAPWSAAAIDDILDRGQPADWVALGARVENDPFGATAETVLKLCAAQHRYGTSNLWSSLVLSARARREPTA